MDGVATSPVVGAGRAVRRAKLVFLTLNDVYELLPNADGQGGVAEFKTLLDATRANVEREHPDATIVVTLNGDFLWRSELDRQDKGPVMMQVLHCLGIEFVVMGNHEFDHSATYLQSLLRSASFRSFGSNIRSVSDGSILDGLEDIAIVPLQDGLKLGMFGVCTTATGEDPFAGPSVRFEDEVAHAKRCVASLLAAGADVIVALTHLKMKQDKQLARQVPELALILGGHDHEPTTEFVGNTMIHKSGQDALWLGNIQLTITKRQDEGDVLQLPRRTVAIEHSWQMLYNRGYAPHGDTRTVVDAYLRDVDADDFAQGKLEPLATARTALDGTRFTLRCGEGSVGYLVTDALRVVLNTDVAIIHAGLIKGDLLNAPGLEITPRWLERTLPQPRATVIVQLPASVLQRALEHLLRRYPAMSSSMPQVSGVRVVYDVSGMRHGITSLRLTAEPDKELIGGADRLLRVALPVVPSLDGWQEFFAGAVGAHGAMGPIVRDVVALYLTRHARAVSYARNEHRLKIVA